MFCREAEKDLVDAVKEEAVLRDEGFGFSDDKEKEGGIWTKPVK